jgi:hypothetical protein
MKASFFHAAVNAVSDRIQTAVTVNFGGMLVYVSRISSNSFGNDPLPSIRIPAFGPDPVKPQLPPSSDDYQRAAAQSQYQVDLTKWQASLVEHHRQLAELKQQVARQLQSLRSLADPPDATGADVFGCLAEASDNLQQVSGAKYLILASPMLNNTVRQRVDDLNFAGVTIEVIWRGCEIAKACEDNASAWRQLFEKHGALRQRISFLDPAESEAFGVRFCDQQKGVIGC